jgi:hypothetical protein
MDTFTVDIFGGEAYTLAVLTCTLNALLRSAPVHIRVLALPKAIIHQAVAQADALLRLCEHHVAGCSGLVWCMSGSIFAPKAIKM